MQYDETYYGINAFRENYEKWYNKGRKDGITSTMVVIVSVSIGGAAYYVGKKLIKKHKENKSKNDE